MMHPFCRFYEAVFINTIDAKILNTSYIISRRMVIGKAIYGKLQICRGGEVMICICFPAFSRFVSLLYRIIDPEKGLFL